MQKSEFEEKDFESPLYNQLLLGSHLIATPGQVFEGAFGIDAALQAEHPIFWDLYGFPDIPAGATLCDFNWGWVWRKYGRRRNLPSFAVNLLVQSKRPDWLKGPERRLSRLGIRGSYWRFAVDDKQQKLLSHISHTLSNRALIVYVSTAFHKLADLYTHTVSGQMVENCSFVRVEHMQNHSKWNYDKPGHSGVAMSEPELIEDVPLLTTLERLDDTTREEPLNELRLLEKLTVSAVADMADNPYAQFVTTIDQYRQEQIYANYPGLPVEVAIFSRLRSIFRSLGLQWFIVLS